MPCYTQLVGSGQLPFSLFVFLLLLSLLYTHISVASCVSQAVFTDFEEGSFSVMYPDKCSKLRVAGCFQ